MPTIIYDFKSTNGIYRPLVPIQINNPIDGGSFRTYALLDTGADECVFPMDVANNTNHNLKGDGVQTNITQGVGNNRVSVWKHTFTINLLSPDTRSVVWNGSPQLVSCLDHNSAPPLLGNKGFLEYFIIGFNYKTKKIVFDF